MKKVVAIRAAILDLIDDPNKVGEDAIRYFEEGLLLIEDGKVKAFDTAENLLDQVPVGVDIQHYKNHLIIPGMIDTHPVPKPSDKRCNGSRNK